MKNKSELMRLDYDKIEEHSFIIEVEKKGKKRVIPLANLKDCIEMVKEDG